MNEIVLEFIKINENHRSLKIQKYKNKAIG